MTSTADKKNVADGGGRRSIADEMQAPAPTERSRFRPHTFTDVTAEAGINFKHNSERSAKNTSETMAPLRVLLRRRRVQDILLVNSMDWPERKAAKSLPALYHNNRNGTFSDVTKEAGLAVEMYGLGCAVADYDNDGQVDIYITCLGANHLFRNLGGGKFSEVTARAGVGDPGFSASAAW